MIVKWKVSIGMARCEKQGMLDVDDDTSDAMIDDIVHEEILSFLNISWVKE